MNYSLSSVSEAATGFASPFFETFGSVVSYLPTLLVAFVLLVVGLVVAPILGGAVNKAFRAIKIDDVADRFGVSKALASVGMNFSIARACGLIVKYVVLIVFLDMVADVLGLAQITALIGDLIQFIPAVIVAVIIIGLGLTAADFAQKAVVKLSDATDALSRKNGELLGSISKIVVIVLSVMAALNQLGIAQVLIQILFAGVVFSLALAFGLGSKDHVAKFLDKILSEK